jgi:nucleotidyltransferase substrate binding protein (TIGR01987 family)
MGQTGENQRLTERFQDFNNAFARLTESLHMKSESSIIIDGAIQRFEFTYELAWKVMRAYLEQQGVFEPKTPRDVFRESYKIGLIADGDGWLDIMTDRNLTSHTYNEAAAREIYQKIKTKHWELFNQLQLQLNGRLSR